MKARTFGRTGWKVSEIGFGAWGIGQKWWGATDDRESIESLKAAWDAGVNFYDTAFVYGDGHSEALIGQALAGKPAYVATKIPPKNGIWPGKAETPVNDVFPGDWIVSCTERSLQRLGRESIDLQQLHVWNDAWLSGGDWQETVLSLKKQGKIKAFGVSINDHDPDSALKLVSSGLVDSVQVIFNIFDQTPAKNLLPLCHKNNVAVIARVPFDEGGLTGTLTVDTKFEGDDFRRQYFRGDNLRATVERAAQLKPLLGQDASTLPELALKFILSHDEISTVIPGMRKKTHVVSNTAVSDKAPLSDQMKTALQAHAWNRNFYGWWDEN